MTYRFHLERDELNERLGGGIPDGALVVIEGEYGSGKSVLTERLLYGFLKNRASVSFVSTELTTLHFIEQMHSLDYPVEEFILDERLLFLPVYPIIGYRGRKTDLIDRLISAKRMYEQDIIILDSYSTLLRQWVRSIEKDESIDPMSGVEESLFHFKLLTTRGKTIVLTMQPGDVDPHILDILRAAADVYLTLKIESAGGTVSRFIFTRRFERAEKNVADIVPFRVEPKAGFIVEIKSVS